MTIDTAPLDNEWRYELAGIMTEFAERLVQTVTREKTSSERKAHLAAIAKITGRWLDGEISTSQKRQEIAAENAFWYGREKRSPATGELLTAAKGTASHVPAARAVPDPDPWGEDDDDNEGLRWDQK